MIARLYDRFILSLSESSEDLIPLRNTIGEVNLHAIDLTFSIVIGRLDRIYFRHNTTTIFIVFLFMKAVEMLVNALKQVRVVDFKSLLQISSALDAICMNSQEMPYTSVNILQHQLEEIVAVLHEILADASYDDVHNLVQKFTSISIHLMEVSWLSIC